MQVNSSARSSPNIKPIWIPPGVKFDQLPAGLQQAITSIFEPVYNERVLAAGTALERAQGLSYCELLWAELLQQFALGEDWGKNLPWGGKSKGSHAKLNRLMSTIALKDKIAKFLLAAEKFFDKAAADPLGQLTR